MSRKQEQILKRFQKRNRLNFKRPELLEEALTHRSYLNEHDDDNLVHNERLEFLGDSVLNYITADLLFHRFPTMTEGELTRLRSALVRTESLAALASRIELGEALRMGKGEISNRGRERANNLCDAFEALVGAIFADKGLTAVRKFVMPLLESQLDFILSEQLDRDPRSTFQEWSQSVLNLTPRYRTIGESGPEHDKLFTVEALIGDKVVGTGTGRSKHAAAHDAARDALKNLRPQMEQQAETQQDAASEQVAENHD